MDFMSILEEWNEAFASHIENIKQVLNDTKSISKEYDISKQDVFDIGFNAFTLASDLYYRENFHSDIIKAILNPFEKHNQGAKYLFLFIDLLNKIKKLNINKSDFQNSQVIREESNIDILIKDDVSKKAIIIENKINNAGDMSRQIPRYYNIVIQNYQVVAIAYLTLDLSKTPDRSTWNEEDKKLPIDNLLVMIPAYERYGKDNLYEHWLVPSMVETQSIDSLFLLKQYGNLLKFLNTSNMDTVSLEKFHETLKQGDNLKTSISIRNMLNDLPEYLAIRIEDKYRNNCSPFDKIWRKGTDAVFEGFHFKDLYFKLDIWNDGQNHTAQFWEAHDQDCNVKEIFKDIEALSDFESKNGNPNSIKKYFSILDEEKLFEFIDNLLTELKNKTYA